MEQEQAAPSPSPARSAELDVQALAASREALLRGWNGHDALWVFAYGSLLWNPELDYEERAPVRAHGYHRQLCVRSVRYRGTPEQPGVVAGLDRGGSCLGLAYRVAGPTVRAQFARLWQREMFLGVYEPRWLCCRRVDDGASLRALGFVVRRDGGHYCGGLGEEELLRVLGEARGAAGSSGQYLLQMVASLRAAGLPDRRLERLAARLARPRPP